MTRRLTCVCALIAVGASSSTLFAAARSYTYYDLTYFNCPTEPLNAAEDVNDAGVVVGYYVTEDCVHIHGFTWYNGVTTDLTDTYEGGLFRSGVAISDGATVLGLGDPDLVLALKDGVATPQPIPPGCEEQGNPKGMNEAGTIIVGECDNDVNSRSVPAVYWIEEGIALDLELLPGLPSDASGEARDVSDDGIVIGVIDNEQRSFTWLDGEMTELFNGLGGEGVTVHAINNHGLIVGTSEDELGLWPAMSYELSTGKMTNLGDGAATSVNDRGSAVGRIIFDFSSSHVVLYEDGEVIDIFEIALANHLTTSHANGINNYGWIVGWGEDQLLRMRGFLLVPEYDKGDYDGDGDVDHQDFQNFQRCFAAEPYQGPEGGLHVGCSVFDFDDDVDLDLTDYAAFQAAFTGPTAPNINPNGPG